MRISPFVKIKAIELAGRALIRRREMLSENVVELHTVESLWPYFIDSAERVMALQKKLASKRNNSKKATTFLSVPKSQPLGVTLGERLLNSYDCNTAAPLKD
jgi:hypothetical protein